LGGTTQEDNAGRSFIARNTGIIANGSPIVHTRGSLHNLSYRTYSLSPKFGLRLVRGAAVSYTGRKDGMYWKAG